MQVQIHAKNVNVTDRLHDHVEKKVSKLDRYLPDIIDARLDLRMERQRNAGERAIAQLTVRHRRGTILRAEDKSQGDILAAVDNVLDKMYRQIRSYKGKRRQRGGERFEELEPALAAAELVPGEIEGEMEDEKTEIVRRKTVELFPMHEEEAIEQMELLGHTFFLFQNADTGGISVAYVRTDGNYGILDAETT